MSTQNRQNAADRPSEKKATEGQAGTTGARPGVPQRDGQGKPTGNSDDRTTNAGPNPGPGITSQGHRVDEDNSTDGNDRDTDRKQPDPKHDLPSSDKPRDQDKDRKDPLDERAADRKMPE